MQSDQLDGQEWYPVVKEVLVDGVPRNRTFRTKPPFAPTLVNAALVEAKTYADTSTLATMKSLGLWSGKEYTITGGAGVDETDKILAAINACGQSGGGTVIIRSANGIDPIYINNSIQIEWDNLLLIYDCDLLYGPQATQRINGGLAEEIRTELGQVNQVKLRADTYTDVEGRMVLPLRAGDGAYIRVDDRLTLRGENDKYGKPKEKQVVTVYAVDGDNVTCYEDPDYTFKAVYPDSEWPADLTTGTTVGISIYTKLTSDGLIKEYTVNVQNTAAFNIGDQVYISTTETEKDLMAPVVTNLKSAAVMEIARIVDKTETTFTFDRALKRLHRVDKGGCIVKMLPVKNSHIVARKISWDAPQPDRKNAALAINYGTRCTISCNYMDGILGRIGIGIRIGYSYECKAFESTVNDAYRFESAEGYGIALYYSTLCSMEDNSASGNRHNYLLQTTTLCKVINNYSSDDKISGIDAHGANAVATLIEGNRVGRSKRYAPGVTNGGGIRIGNTSHTLGDHDTIIRNNLIEGYIGEKCAGVDISPSSRNAIIRNNTFIDCTIGVRHYNVGSAIDPAQYTDLVVIDGNDFIRCSEPTYIRNWTNSIWSKVVLSNNRSINNAKHFKIEDIPHLLAYGNVIIDPIDTAGEYAFDFQDIAYLRVFNNYAMEANRGVRAVNCGNVKVIRNFLSDTREAFPIYQTGNTSFIEAANDDTGGGGGGGTPVEFQTTGTVLQWREVGDPDWIDLFQLSELQGTDGLNGVDGREIEVQSTSTHLQWRYVGDVTWTNLLALSAILDVNTQSSLFHFIVPLGDSRSAQNWSYSNTTPALLSRSPLFHAEQISRKCRVISKWRQGVSGNEVEDIWNRIVANTPNDVGIGPQDVPTGITWFFLAGTNNITGATTKAYIDAVLAVHKQIVDWAVARGDRVIVGTEWPRVASSSPSGTLTATEQKLFQYYVRKLKSQYRGAANVRLTDVWEKGVDPSSATADAIAELLNPDGLHNSVAIAYLQGKEIATVLDEWDYPTIYWPTASNADLYDATYNPSGNLHSNPLFKGTTGTLSTNATGVAPDGWTMDATSGLSVVGSRETITLPTGKIVDAFKMEISGTTTAQGAYARLRRSGLISTILANDVTEAGAEVLVATNHSNYNQVGIVIDPGITSDQVHGGVNLGGTNGDNAFPASLVEQQYVFPRSPQYVVPATPPASLALDYRVRFSKTGTVSSATIYFISSSFRKTALDG